MTQRTLFTGQDLRAPLARATDPAPSHESAREHVASGQNDSQKSEVLDCLRRLDRPVTSAELASLCDLDRYMVARRLSDLRHERRVEQCEARLCRVGGRGAVTWRAR